MPSVETLIFDRLHPWLGLRLHGTLAPETPVIVAASGDRRPMRRIEDPVGGGSWWIEDGPWDPEGRRHLGAMQRTAGRYDVEIGGLSLRVDAVTTHVGPQALQELIDEFRGDLVWLLLDENSGATGSVAGAGGASRLADLAEAFEAALRRILRDPATGIRETVGLRPVARLRSRPATFRDHARRPSAPELTSRVVETTADIPENRHLRSLARLVRRLLAATARAASMRSRLLDQLARHAHEHAESLLLERRLLPVGARL